MDTVPTGADTAAGAHVTMSFPVLPGTGFSHAVREHRSAPSCGADDVTGSAAWPAPGQPWP